MLEVGSEKMKVNDNENGQTFGHIQPEKSFHAGGVNSAGGI
jgi:hypothetical protein